MRDARVVDSVQSGNSTNDANGFGEEVGMNPTAYFHHPRSGRPHDDDGTGGAMVIAILFALLAAVSFVVDFSLSLPE